MHVQISLLFLIKPATSAAAPVDDFSPRVWRATSGYFLDERITMTSDIYLPLMRSIIKCYLYMWKYLKWRIRFLDPSCLQFSHPLAVMEHSVTVCMQWIRQFQFKLNCCSKFVALWLRWKELCDFVSATFYFVNEWEALLCDLSHLHRHGVACLCIWKKTGGKQVSTLSQCDKLCGTVKLKTWI